MNKPEQTKDKETEIIKKKYPNSMYGAFGTPDNFLMTDFLSIPSVINGMRDVIFAQNKKVGWWTEDDMKLEGKEKITLVASKLALVHSEVSEALEGLRKNKMDDHLPSRSSIEVEIADSIIRLLDIAGFMGLDVGGAITEKFDYNARRSDHKLSNRNAEGGKVI